MYHLVQLCPTKREKIRFRRSNTFLSQQKECISLRDPFYSCPFIYKKIAFPKKEVTFLLCVKYTELESNYIMHVQ